VTKAISAIILAAGDSRRMGQPKLFLPWGQTNVLGQVVGTFSSAGIEDIIVVTGRTHESLEAEVLRLSLQYPVRVTHNPLSSSGGMLSSIQAGLIATDPAVSAVLIGLGDQPQVQEETIRAICSAFSRTGAALVFPSFQNRRGHPWLASRTCWTGILALPHSTNPRKYIKNFPGQIEYIEADESILDDLDTPEDYQRQHP
jgi:molybdenum cofactor cytidylyltransferase